MGSINPVVITGAALAERADDIADGLVASITMGTGQFCTNPGLVLLQDSPAAQDFIAAVTEKMSAAPAGVLLNETIARGLESAVGQTRTNPDISVLTGGEAIAESDSFCFSNTVMQTSAAAIRADDRLQVEHFGPVTLFVVCDDGDDLRATVDALEGNLTSTIHAEAEELEDISDLLHQLREKAGRVIWNGLPHRRRRRAGHAAWRTLPGDDRARHHLGRHERDIPLHASHRLSECAGRAAAPGLARRQSAGDSPLGG